MIAVRSLFVALAVALIWRSEVRASPHPIIFGQALPNMYPQEVDLGMNEILINNRMTTEQVLGKDITAKIEEKSLSFLRCHSRDSSEILDLFHHPNSPFNSFQEFHVFLRDTAGEDGAVKESICSLSPQHFISYRGVRLGMSINELIEIFGDNYRTESKSGEITLCYSIDSNMSSAFLQHYKRQRYEGRYLFRKGRLYRYEFGFDRRY